MKKPESIDGLQSFFPSCVNDSNQKLMQIKQSKEKENKYLSRLIDAVKLSSVPSYLICIIIHDNSLLSS